jgi:hypothetical protein
MGRFALRTAVVSAFVVGASVSIFFGFLNHSGDTISCGVGCIPHPVFVAKVPIPQGTSGRVIATKALYSTKYVQRSQMVKGASDLAVAPGVWVDRSPQEAAIDQHVANGILVGDCRSVRAFQAHNPKIPFATKCWRT